MTLSCGVSTGKRKFPFILGSYLMGITQWRFYCIMTSDKDTFPVLRSFTPACTGHRWRSQSEASAFRSRILTRLRSACSGTSLLLYLLLLYTLDALTGVSKHIDIKNVFNRVRLLARTFNKMKESLGERHLRSTSGLKCWVIPHTSKVKIFLNPSQQLDFNE